MKKFIYILSILSIGIFSSCNEDIPIDEVLPSFDVTFRLNPETVVESFYNTRLDIERLYSTEKLRLRLLIYNEQGTLVSSSEKYVGSYLEKEDVTVNLVQGSYFAIAISDVVEPNDQDAPELWTLSGEQSINSLTVTDAGYIGGESKVLGVNGLQFNVNKNGDNFTMELKPVGAIIYIRYDNIHMFNDVQEYNYECTKIAEKIQFDRSGNVTPSFSTGLYYLSKITPSNLDKYNNVGVYAFVLPMQDLPTAFFAKVNGESLQITDALVLSNILSGKEYYAYIDLASDEDSFNAQCKHWDKNERGPWEQNSNSPRIKSPNMEKQFTRANHNFNLPQRSSIKVKDLIK